MNKICTSLEQSQKLIESGIDINTADFMWEYNSDKETYWNKPTIIPIDDYIFVNDIPAWSLSALLKLFDDKAGIAKEYGTWFAYDNGKSHCTKHYDNPIDACYEMIIHLHEQNLLCL